MAPPHANARYAVARGFICHGDIIPEEMTHFFADNHGMPQPTSHFSHHDYLSALVIVVIWGSNFIFMKFALHDFTPFQMGAARYIFAVFPLILFIKRPNLDIQWLLLYGLFQGVGQFGFLFVGLKLGMTAALASVLMQTQVFFTALFGFLLLGEKPSRSLQIGLCLAALGLACFAMNYIAPQATNTSATTIFGLIFCVLAAFMWAASNIVVRKAQQSLTKDASFDAVAFLVWSSTVPILPFIALSLLLDAESTRWRWLAAPWSGWVSVAFLGWVATIAAYAMWTSLLKRHPANRVAPFSLGVPVVGITAGMVVLGEQITAWQWGGIALVVAALLTVMFGQRVWERVARST
jgi:O-acetylserine/cysteine efflux transporter